MERDLDAKLLHIAPGRNPEDRQIAFEPEDAEGFRFADGWVERLGIREDGGETPPGCIPETFEDEKIAWDGASRKIGGI